MYKHIGLFLVKTLKSSEKKFGSIMCKEKYHENEPVEYFCEDCKVCICHKCGVTVHNHHNKKDVQHATEDIKNQMEKIVQKIKAKAVSVEAKVKEQTNLMLKTQEEISSAEREMIKVVEEKIRLLNKHRADVKTKLSEILEAQVEEHETRIKHFQMVATQINKFAGNGEDLLKQEIIGPEILETECHVVFTVLEKLLNDEEMEIYKPKCVTYCDNNKQERLFGKIVEFHPYLSTPVCEENPPAANLSSPFEGSPIQSKVVASSGPSSGPTASLSSPFEGSPIQSKVVASLGPSSGPTASLSSPFEGSPIESKVVAYLGPNRIIQICRTASVAVSEKTGYIAVIEQFKHGVHLFDSEWKFLRTIGDKGTGEEIMDRPISVAFTSSGNILVVQVKGLVLNSRLSVFTERGHYITDISKHVLRPRSVSVRKDVNLLLCNGCGVEVLSPDGTKLIQTIKAPYCDELPCFAVYHQGMFFVSYDSLHCVKTFSDEGQFLYEIGCKGTGDGQLRSPQGLVIDELNNLVVCDTDNKRLQVFSLEGKFLNSVTEDVFRPESVTVAENGDLLFCDL